MVTKSEFNPDWAMRPADHIREYLECNGWTQADLSRASGIPRGRVSDLLSGRRSVTPELAIKLEKAFGLNAQVWLALQANWDVFEARKKEKLRNQQD